MANVQAPLPPPSNPYDQHGDPPSQVFYLYLQSLDMLVRALAGNNVGPLTGVAAPTNANAAAAGVAIGQLYRSTADPAAVFIRTV